MLWKKYSEYYFLWFFKSLMFGANAWWVVLNQRQKGIDSTHTTFYILVYFIKNLNLGVLFQFLWCRYMISFPSSSYQSHPTLIFERTPARFSISLTFTDSLTILDYNQQLYRKFGKHRVHILPAQGLFLVFNDSYILNLIKCLSIVLAKPILHTR